MRRHSVMSWLRHHDYVISPMIPASISEERGSKQRKSTCDLSRIYRQKKNRPKVAQLWTIYKIVLQSCNMTSYYLGTVFNMPTNLWFSCTEIEQIINTYEFHPRERWYYKLYIHIFSCIVSMILWWEKSSHYGNAHTHGK